MGDLKYETEDGHQIGPTHIEWKFKAVKTL